MTLPFPEPATGPLAVTLRPYQNEAVEALFSWFGKSEGNPLIVVPTGGGKSLIIAGFVHRVLSQWPNERILVLTHVRELITQNHAQMLRAWPSAPAGIYSAGLKRREHDARVLFAGIQSVYDKAALIGWADLILIDEAHLIPKSGFGMYRTLIDALRSMNSSLKLIGLTATPFRTGEGSLAAGEDRLFHGIAYSCDIVQLIRDGHLSHVTAKAGKDRIATAGLHIRMGDFVEAELESAAMAPDLVARQCAEIVKRGADRKSWLVFCCSVAHAEDVAAQLSAIGVSVRTVFGETPKEERDEVTKGFKDGAIRCIVNVNVLTTGFDAPGVDLLVLLRPTMSPVLYVQMIGRGLRVAPDKADCLALDFGGNVERHGPIDEVNIKEPGKVDKDTVLARTCPECSSLVSIRATVCPECGYEWALAEPESTPRTDEKPGELDIIRGMAPPESPKPSIATWAVDYVVYTRHEGKDGKPASLRVTYWCGVQQVNEWVCFDHPEGSFPRRKANQWWQKHGGDVSAFPQSVEDARYHIELGAIGRVKGVVADVRGQWPTVLNVVMASDADDDLPATAPSQSDIDYSDLPF